MDSLQVQKLMIYLSLQNDAFNKVKRKIDEFVKNPNNNKDLNEDFRVLNDSLIDLQKSFQEKFFPKRVEFIAVIYSFQLLKRHRF